MGPTTQLARHVATLRYEQLPRELVELIKQCILDTLGVVRLARAGQLNGRIAVTPAACTTEYAIAAAAMR
jgi:2-methylcitrate dehydratase PrpD